MNLETVDVVGPNGVKATLTRVSFDTVWSRRGLKLAPSQRAADATPQREHTDDPEPTNTEKGED